MSSLITIHRPDGTPIDSSALTKRILSHINTTDTEAPDPWLGLTLQEGAKACQLLAQESYLLEAALRLQPSLMDFFLLMYQIGVKTANTVNNNNLSITVNVDIEENNAHSSEKNNIGDDKNTSANTN